MLTLLELKRGTTMAGSTCFHSSSLVQGDRGFSPSGFWGIEVAGFRPTRRSRLKIRNSHESVGFMCFSEADGGLNGRVARLLESTSSDSSWGNVRRLGEGKAQGGAQGKEEEGLMLSRQVDTTASSESSRDSSEANLRSGEDVKVALQRVLKARAIMESKLKNDQKEAAASAAVETEQEDVKAKNTINMAREVLAGYRKAAVENGRGGAEESTADNGNGVQVWGASLIRSGLPKPLTAKGSLWRRDLGTVHDLHGLTDQPDSVRKVVEALSGLRSHVSVINTMNSFVGQVTVSDLHQVVYVLGFMKEWLTALQVFQWMQSIPQYKPDELAYRSVINVLVNARRMSVAETVFEEFTKSGLSPSHDDYVILMSGYTKCGSLQRGVNVLQKMRDAGISPLVSAYNVVLDGCNRSIRGLETAAQLRDQMRQESVEPDSTTFAFMINMYSRKGMYKEIIDTYDQMRSSSFVPERNVCHLILTAYSKLGDVRGMMDAHRFLMDLGLQQVSVTFNIILNTLNRVGRLRDVERYWAFMRKSRVVLDLTTCSILINAFGRAREWEKIDSVLADMETYGIKADLMVYNALISVYGKAGLFYEVTLVVRSLRAEIARLEELGKSSLAMDLVTYNTLLDVYGKGGRLNDVIYWFAEMKKAGVQPDVVTFNSLVNAYGKASHYDGVKEVLELFREYNYKSDLVFYNTLLFMFGRGGHYADAWKILEDMKDAGFAPTLETYNSLILVFGRGSVQQGLQVFADMIESNVDPNVVTFRLLMDIHAKKGLVDECLQIYTESEKYPNCKFDESLMSAALRACCNMRCIEKAEVLVEAAEAAGVVTPLACYNWLILGHGRKGHWQEAERIIERMRAKGLCPGPQSFSFLLEAYSLGGQIPKGETLITKMREERLICGTAGHNALLRFYMRTGDVSSLLQTYESIESLGLKPNISSYVPMIEALTKEGVVDARLWKVTQDLENAGFNAHYTIHGALLSSLGRCGQGQDSDRLVEVLQRLGCSPDVCNLFQEELGEEGSRSSGDAVDSSWWKQISTLFQAMEREGINMEAERNYHNALIDALWKFEYRMRALKVTELSVAFGVFGSHVCRWDHDCWALDVRFSGTGAAQILLLTWLAGIRQTVKAGQKLPPKLRIVLAWEWQLRTGENWGARDGVSAHLISLKAPFALVKEGQELEATATTFRKWLLKEKTAQGLVFTSKL